MSWSPAVGFRKRAQQHFTVSDCNRTFVNRAVTRLAAVERETDVASRRDEQFDATFSIIFGQFVPQNELVRPGHLVAGFILTRWINDQQVKAQSRGRERLILELRTGVGNGTILRVMDPRRRAGILRIDFQTHLTRIIGSDSAMT